MGHKRMGRLLLLILAAIGLSQSLSTAEDLGESYIGPFNSPPILEVDAAPKVQKHSKHSPLTLNDELKESQDTTDVDEPSPFESLVMPIPTTNVKIHRKQLTTETAKMKPQQDSASSPFFMASLMSMKLDAAKKLRAAKHKILAPKRVMQQAIAKEPSSPFSKLGQMPGLLSMKLNEAKKAHAAHHAASAAKKKFVSKQHYSAQRLLEKLEVGIEEAGKAGKTLA